MISRASRAMERERGWGAKRRRRRKRGRRMKDGSCNGGGGEAVFVEMRIGNGGLEISCLISFLYICF